MCKFEFLKPGDVIIYLLLIKVDAKFTLKYVMGKEVIGHTGGNCYINDIYSACHPSGF